MTKKLTLNLFTGKLFAMFSIRFGFAAIVSNFILEPFPNAPAPNDVTVEKKGLFYGPGEVLSVKFVERNERDVLY